MNHNWGERIQLFIWDYKKDKKNKKRIARHRSQTCDHLNTIVTSLEVPALSSRRLTGAKRFNCIEVTLIILWYCWVFRKITLESLKNLGPCSFPDTVSYCRKRHWVIQYNTPHPYNNRTYKSEGPVKNQGLEQLQTTGLLERWNVETT